MKKKKKLFSVALLTAMVLSISGCTESERVSSNISQEADNFNVLRRLTVINSRTDKIEFELIGAFSLKVDDADNQLEITCEMDDGNYRKHFIGLNEYVMYVVEDVGGAKVNKYKYEVNFLPEMVQPVDVKSED